MTPSFKTPRARVGEPPIFEKGAPGRVGVSLPAEDVGDVPLDLPPALLRKVPPLLPEVTEPEVVRHYTRLSQLNASIDTHMYPLGSCTMKYNPRLNERVARMPGFALAHPLAPEGLQRGLLQILCELGLWLQHVTGLDAVTLQPAAGAHGELTGVMMIRAALKDRGDARRKILVPDSAHGTNPATGALNGYEIVPIKTGPEGHVKVEAVRAVMAQDVAAIMMTNPNTLGVFERDIKQIADVVHQGGGLVYMDGANLNALLGVATVADFGVDVVHVNLHKTFSTPHGGGGPGAGPVLCVQALAPYLPTPVVVGPPEAARFDHDRPKSIGKVKSFYGNFGMLLRAHCYINELGAAGVMQVGRDAIVSANYVRAALKGVFELAFDAPTMHEAVFTDKRQKEHGVSTLDVAKRLIDLGFHPPTIYFPLIAPGALMIEPTESEPKETLDEFVAALKQIDREAQETPELVKNAPTLAPARRFDEALAARKPVLRYRRQGSGT
ncbi:MAG: aminomethyl-transferring glycine dehydrogenase subunit GcvPB [Deltaproteobacteria bacterium]|nr:aminomethyl-transferring glycine dehydrogenase subunit GcvPB [Deltaproteobacteria bacterium]